MTSLFFDLLGFLGTAFLAAVLFLGLHLVAASLKLMRGVNYWTVVLAVVCAVLAGIVAWAQLGGWFSSPAVHALASVASPITFLGFCGIYILIVPVTINRSISLSMLIALEASQHKRLMRDQLQAEVPFHRIFEKRLRELELSRSIDASGPVTITPTGMRIIRLYVRIARLFNVEFQ